MSFKKIPATVITGFLGAGKTTLVRHLLANANGRRIALLVNEFGDVGVDGEILKACGFECREGDIVELTNGCICCTVADDFIPTMTKLLARDPAPDHIVIETSGLALPQPLVRAFNWPEIRAQVTVDGVVTVVDAAAFADGRFAVDERAIEAQRAADPSIAHDDPIEELFQDQLTCADMVLLNKSDLLEPPILEQVKAEVKTRLRQGTSLVATQNGRIAISALLGMGAEAESLVAQRPSHHELEGESEHNHDEFESFVVPVAPLNDRAAFLDRLRDIVASHDILRLKGFLSIDGIPARLLVQAVGPRIDSYFDRPWRDEEARNGSVVVIGLKGMDREAITADFAPA